MTKTLTEQWKNGELNGGHYYLFMRDGSTRIANTVYVVGEKQFYWENSSIDFVQEVLAPVPSYEEWHKLKDLGLRPDYTDHIEKWEDCARLTMKVKRLQEQKQKVIALIKDGRFVEALRVLQDGK